MVSHRPCVCWCQYSNNRSGWAVGCYTVCVCVTLCAASAVYRSHEERVLKSIPFSAPSVNEITLALSPNAAVVTGGTQASDVMSSQC